MSGNLTQSACSKDASSGAGCTIVDSATNSYGAGFAAAGGGVYVCEFGDEGVKIWFFTVSLAMAMASLRIQLTHLSDRPFRPR